MFGPLPPSSSCTLFRLPAEASTTRRPVAVEPEACPTLHNAQGAGHPVDVTPGGVAANALGARRIGDICFELARSQQITTTLVPDEAITAAQVALWREARLLVEPAGATALAALMCGAYRPSRGERVAVLLCGANPTDDPFPDPV